MKYRKTLENIKEIYDNDGWDWLSGGSWSGYSYREVNKEFTEIVNYYLGNGYTINTATMNTRGDEITKIDLVDNITHKLMRVTLFGVSGEEFNWIIIVSEIKIDFDFLGNSFAPYIHAKENVPFVTFTYKEENN